jgi:hypothetical protein
MPHLCIPQGDDFFSFLTFTWNVTAARVLVEGRIANGTVTPSQVVGEAGKIIRMSPEEIAAADTTTPLIYLDIPGLDQPMIIDGWANIFRAAELGITTYPVHRLSEAEGVIVMEDGADLLVKVLKGEGQASLAEQVQGWTDNADELYWEAVDGKAWENELSKY